VATRSEAETTPRRAGILQRGNAEMEMLVYFSIQLTCALLHQQMRKRVKLPLWTKEEEEVMEKEEVEEVEEEEEKEQHQRQPKKLWKKSALVDKR